MEEIFQNEKSLLNKKQKFSIQIWNQSQWVDLDFVT